MFKFLDRCPVVAIVLNSLFGISFLASGILGLAKSQLIAQVPVWSNVAMTILGLFLICAAVGGVADLKKN